VLSSYDVLGGPATFNLVWATSRFRNENPKVYAAFVKALDESIAMIYKDKKWAADLYLRMSKSKNSPDETLKILDDPKSAFMTTPQNVMKYVDFMLKIGSINVKPQSWKDLFFPEAHNLPGG
jgi:NitT/TauT family transport system substrate-binding protein